MNFEIMILRSLVFAMFDILVGLLSSFILDRKNLHWFYNNLVLSKSVPENVSHKPGYEGVCY